MAKSFTASKKQLKPDARYGSELASKFINCMMHDGKKGVAMLRFYEAMDMLEKKIPETPPIEIFTQAIDNVKPSIEVRSKRVGGATYQVPTPVNSIRQRTLAIRWILAACRGRKGRGIAASMADEFAAAYKREGVAMTTRDNVHKMADANKAFAHFAW
jgi:small subunit ribosomal protein S7